jgi:exopolysaccharide/PEP-CTERM locus tyrosine autokinase
MERIKQALDKARLERHQAGGILPPSKASVVGDRGISGQIEYTQTRTVEVSKDFRSERRIISGAEHNASTEAYRILRTQILQRLREKGWNSLAITSPGQNEGKTLTAINLAISLAMEVDHSVLLVDADLRHPTVHTYFGIEPKLGLSDYLTSDVQLPELLIHPSDIPRFVILPGGSPLPNSSEMLNSPKLVRLVDELKRRYPSRIVLFDLPPLLSVADTLAFSPYVDAALLVIEEGKTKAPDLQHAVALLQGTTLIGTVLNKSTTNSTRDSEPKWMRLASDRLQQFVFPVQAWFDRIRRSKF